MKRRTLLGAGCSMAASLALRPAWSAVSGARIDDIAADTHEDIGAPGLAIGIVRAGQPALVRGYGYADPEAKAPVTAYTAFHVASVSKPVTGTAMMMLLERGRYRLDEPIARHLDFPVVHPLYPDVPITFRHLFTHTSGISDATYDATGRWTAPNEATPPLRDFLAGYLAPGGRWYDPKRAFSVDRPGARFAYSNVGVSLLGYLAGRVGERPLDDLTREALFEPLGMDHTAWRMDGLRDASVAVPYARKGRGLERLPPRDDPAWPADMLRTSAHDLCRFLRLFCEGGQVDGHAYLKPDTLRSFFADQRVRTDATHDMALIWMLNTADGTRMATHGGSDPGTATLVGLDLDRGIGALALANISNGRGVGGPLRDLVQHLLKEGRSL